MAEPSAVPINWYPGHMAKTKRLLTDQIRKVDLVIELCDARLPHSSRNPEIGKMCRGKKRIVLLNKADLADPDITSQWIRTIRNGGQAAFAVDSTKLKSKELISLIQRTTQDLVDRAGERGIRKTVKVMVAGVPNVGIAQTGDRPGVTKSSQWVRITPYLELLDTPGLLWPRLDNQTAARRLCYIGSIKDEVIDQYMLAVSLLEELEEISPDAVLNRYHLDRSDMKGAELLDAACKGRGWLLKGNQYDYDRACSIILDEFRGGKLGRISLEKPETEEGNEE